MPKYDGIANLDETMPYTVAVDLDGTLAEFDHWRGLAHIGKPVKKVIDYIAKIRAEHDRSKIIIHTARIVDPQTGLLRSDAIKYLITWLSENKIDYDQIWVEMGKPYAHVYLDDRALNVNQL